MGNYERMLRRTSATWLAGLLLASAIFPAAADDGKPRYVAGTGRDQGDCQNRFRPCRTLSYAIGQAGKGDRIQVAEGSYSVRDSKQLYDLLSVPGRINAGFSKVSGYAERNATPDTVLIGVPPEFRERFQAAGFTVIVDTKSLGVSEEEAQRMRKLTATFTAAEQSHAATPCVGNSSAGFLCQSVSLLAHLSLQDLRPAGAAGNDVWGFTDLNTGREYAFMGLQNGVAVLDVTNPEAPELVGTASGTSTTWRDIKVYQVYDASAARWRAFAYATADAVVDQLMMLDLSNLPNGIERLASTFDVRAAHNAYIVNADYTFGLAQTPEAPRLGVSGAALNVGNYRLYSLANPRAPELQNVVTFGYSHDLASFPVTDSRKNDQCVNAQAQAQCQVVSDFNENTVDIWDVSNPSTPERLASHAYTGAGYVHSGWWSEDGRHLFVHDELDEFVSANTRVRVFDMLDLRAPVLAGAWVGPTRATDHNGYAKGNRYYISNYSEGLTVLDVTNPATPTRVGYFDTFPATAEVGFVGAWGVYPFFASGTIAVGDINSGLYLLRNETLATPRGSFSMTNASLAGTEGQSLTVSVSRTGGGTGAASVQVELLHANTTAADASLGSTMLNWADGDTEPKITTIALAADGQTEDLELLLVRLKNPQGGATISYPDTTWVTVGDTAQSTRLRALDFAPRVEDTRAKVLITVTRRASSAGEARLSYRTVAGGTFGGAAPTQGELVWADGDAGGKVATVTLDPATLGPGQSGTFNIELFNAINATLEASDGSNAAVVPLTVTVSDPATPAPPPPGGGGGGRGGGSIGVLWLALLATLFAARTRRRPTTAAAR